jgi:hypothetical protein
MVEFKKINKMETGKLIASLLMMACFIVPFTIMGIRKKRNKKQIVNSLSDYAKQNLCKIDEYEVCEEYVIGIDKGLHFLFFLQKGEEENQFYKINLNEIKSAKKLITRDSSGRINRLAIAFYPLKKNVETLELEFYNSEQKFEINNELQTLEKWNLIISDQLQ